MGEGERGREKGGRSKEEAEGTCRSNTNSNPNPFTCPGFVALTCAIVCVSTLIAGHVIESASIKMSGVL